MENLQHFEEAWLAGKPAVESPMPAFAIVIFSEFLPKL